MTTPATTRRMLTPINMADPSCAATGLLRSFLTEASNVVAFTGAGISTESGVPDFRSPGSPWRQHKPVDFADFIASPLARAEAWRRKFAMDDLYAGARPGRGHQVLAHFVETGTITGIITQNIDGLHASSGVGPEKIVELHGNGTYAVCLSCHRRHELADVRARFEAGGQAPTCGCGGMVKSATISFGQAMPREPMRRAQALTQACDLFLVIGSSLAVQPAASFPALARQGGARLVIINREPTPLDALADLCLRGEIGPLLAPFLTQENFLPE